MLGLILVILPFLTVQEPPIQDCACSMTFQVLPGPWYPAPEGCGLSTQMLMGKKADCTPGCVERPCSATFLGCEGHNIELFWSVWDPYQQEYGEETVVGTGTPIASPCGNPPVKIILVIDGLAVNGYILYCGGCLQ